MKIVYLTYNTKNNGGNKVIFEHVNKLIERNYEVQVVTLLGEQPNWIHLKVKIKKMWDFHKEKNIDILVSTFWPTVFFALTMKARKKVHFIQGWEEDFYSNFLLRFFARLSIKIPFHKLTTSHFLSNKIHKYYYDNKIKIYKIKCLGVHIDPSKNIKHHGANKKARILSIVSSYNHVKGVDQLTKAVKNIKLIHPEYEFTLVSVEKYPFSNVFDKFISNPNKIALNKLYRESDLLLNTSRSEGFFIPGLEAFSHGCPVITTDCGGIHEYGTHNKNMIILKRIEDLWEKDSIGELLKNYNLRRKIICKGYTTSKKYQWNKIIYDLEKFYLSLNK